MNESEKIETSTIFSSDHLIKLNSKQESINKADEDNLNDDDKPYLPSVFYQKKELKIQIQEIVMTRTFFFSQTLMIFVVILFYFTYKLAGDYLSLVVFALMTSMAIRPTKQRLVNSLADLLTSKKRASKNMKKKGVEEKKRAAKEKKRGVGENKKGTDEKKKGADEQQKYSYFYQRSLIYLIFFRTRSTLHFLVDKVTNFKFKTFTEDIYLLIIVLLVYLGYRLQFMLILILTAGVFLGDLLIRLLLDLTKFKPHDDKMLSYIDSVITPLFIISFFILMLGIVIVGLLLTKNEVEYFTPSLQIWIDKVNEIYELFMGAPNKITIERLSFILNFQNTTTIPFFDNPVIQNHVAIFQNITSEFLATFSKNATNSSTLANGSQVSMISVMSHFVNEVSTLYPLDEIEFENCMQNSSYILNFQSSFPFLEYPLSNILKYYCSFATYAMQFKINFVEIINKFQKIIFFIIQLFFGTIFIEFGVIFSTVLDYFFNFLIYIFCLYYMLRSKRNAFSMLASFMPLFQQSNADKLTETLDKTVQGIFVSPIKISLYHIIFTWLFFQLFGLKFAFIPSLLAGVMSLIPLFSPWMVSVPAGIYLYFGERNPIGAILLPLGYMVVSNKVFTDIYKKNISIHPYFAGLSVFFGFVAFNFKGIIYGPLLVCLVFIIYDIAKSYNEISIIPLRFSNIAALKQLEKIKIRERDMNRSD